MLRTQTETGLTFGQIIAVLGLVGMLIAAWITLTNKTTENSVRIAALEIGYNRIEANQTEIMKENKADHIALAKKIDETNNLLIDYFTGRRK